MKPLITFIFISICAFLSACTEETRCPEYRELTKMDRNNDGETDYRFQFIGDSIIAYNEIACMGVAHNIGLAVQEPIQSHALIGAKVHEIQEQFVPAADEMSDYDWVIINGGLNDLIANEKVGDSEALPCDCNENPNHDACLQEIEDVSVRMSTLLASVQTQTQANIAIMSYYPAEVEPNFIGECFPYVELMHDRYREIAEQNQRITFVETYGVDFPTVEKVNQFGYDNYHPTPAGSQQLAQFIIQQAGIPEPPTQLPETE